MEIVNVYSIFIKKFNFFSLKVYFVRIIDCVLAMTDRWW